VALTPAEAREMVRGQGRLDKPAFLRVLEKAGF
jgi:hypothetical protein